MEDPLSASSAIAFVAATLQSSRALYQAIQSFRDHPRVVRQLKDEVEGLNAALNSLKSLVESDTSLLATLRIPLARCCQACTDFRALILKHTTRSGGSKTSFRDWIALKYMDGDINGFTSMLAGYKATICIVLADANLLSNPPLQAYTCLI